MPKKLCIYIPYYDNGGVERMLVNLANGIVALGVDVDFVVCDTSRPYLSKLSPHIHLLPLAAPHLAETIRYLTTARPNAMLCAKESSLELALKAQKRGALDIPIYCRAVTNSSRQLQDKNVIVRWIRKLALKRYYRQVNGIIAVSRGVADDIREISGISVEKIKIANNPVITPELATMSNEDISHPWLAAGQPPVIIGIGRLSRAKNFPLLLEAFALVRKKMDCRLLILGEGRQRALLNQRASQLGLADDFMLPGFVENPYPYLKNAALFVLSSHWEGSPNVLTEALALGTPVVSTDCPSGPREILQEGRYGTLVPVNNAAALAQAMEETLRNPLSPQTLRSAAESYNAENSARQYLAAMKLDPEQA